MYKVKPGRACSQGEGGTRDAESQNSCKGELLTRRNEPGKPSALKGACSVWERVVWKRANDQSPGTESVVSIALASPFGDGVTR